MKEQHPMDELFRSRLYDHSYDPPMHLWGKVAARRKPAVFRRPFIPVLIGGTMVALTLAILLWPSPDHTLISYFPIELPSDAQGAATEDNQAPEPLQTIAQNLTPSHPVTPIGQAPIAKGARSGLTRKSIDNRPSIIMQEGPIAPSQYVADAERAAAAPEPEKTGAERATASFSAFSALPARLTMLEQYPITDRIPGIRFLGKRWYASVDLAISKDWHFRQLEPSAPEYAAYADARDHSESFRSGLTVATRLSLVSAGGVIVGSGLQVSRFSETFRFTENQERLTINGTDTIRQIVSVSRQQGNVFHTVDIPVFLGYEFSMGRLNLALRGGAHFNMAFNQKGRFYAPTGTDILEFSSALPDAYPAFRNRLGVGYFGSLTLSHPITPSLHVLAEPYFRRYPGSYTAKDYPLDQHYWSGGIFIGVRKLIGPYWMNLRP